MDTLAAHDTMAMACKLYSVGRKEGSCPRNQSTWEVKAVTVAASSEGHASG